MANKAARGTKLKCQNEECELPFYDLNVEQPSCPTCGTEYDHEAQKEKEQAAASTSYRRGRVAPVFEIVAPEGPAEAETDDDADSTEEGSSDQILDMEEDGANDANLPGPAKDPTAE